MYCENVKIPGTLFKKERPKAPKRKKDYNYKEVVKEREIYYTAFSYNASNILYYYCVISIDVQDISRHSEHMRMEGSGEILPYRRIPGQSVKIGVIFPV